MKGYIINKWVMRKAAILKGLTGEKDDIMINTFWKVKNMKGFLLQNNYSRLNIICLKHVTHCC